MKNTTKKAYNAFIKRMDGASYNNKVKNYLGYLITDTAFSEDVSSLREKYNIPKNGLGLDKVGFIERLKKQKSRNPNLNMVEYFGFEVGQICHKYKLDAFDEFVSYYVLYNKLNNRMQKTPFSVIDLYDLTHNQTKAGYLTNEEAYFYLSAQSMDHPIGILIQPYASQRDIIDFIKRSYKFLIKPIQNKHADKNTKLGKVRKKNSRVKERNKFILKNSKLHPKKIASLVLENFGDNLEYTYISKIIKNGNKISVRR